MNTSQIKNFAAQSRNILKAGVIQRIQILGFDVDGNLTKGEPTRIEIQGGATLFAGEIFDGSFYDRWMSLRHRIQEKGVKEVYEEAAYTWFNRLVAIRIMQKNGFIDPVLAYTNEQTRIPRIVAEARAGRVGKMTPVDREKLRELMGDDARVNEQFALLIDNFCRSNAVIFNCFGGIEEYISLLLPDNILAPGGFIDLLNHTSYITDEDFKQSELIGWLYQFYISERKDEVFDKFKKGKKAEAEDIPAATQIFTPNWIVKYMVQNTIGRIYLDNNPWATDIKDAMRYLVEPTEPTPKDAILKLESIEDYKLLDNACGSGHILVEAFGLFYMMYLEEGYSSHNAIESILRKNLLGIDLDTRAKQLATFALLMTAAKIDPSFLDCKVMPRVLDMPGHSFSKPVYELLREFYIGEDRTVMDETLKAFELLEQAENLGSIMKFDLSAKTRREMALRFKEWEEMSLKSEVVNRSKVLELLPSFSLVLALTDSYTAVVLNPPYMSSSNMNPQLLSYVVNHYSNVKTDLFSVFMSLGLDMISKSGKMGMINMQSWMFLSSFEALRGKIISNYQIDSLLHLGPHTFDELAGEVVQNSAFIISKNTPSFKGIYYRLVEGNCCSEKESAFLSNTGLYSVDQRHQFKNIPGELLAYWIGEQMLNIFSNNEKLIYYCKPSQGLATGENGRFLRLWFEPNIRRIGFNINSIEQSIASNCRWFPYNKGGEFRKWYGNQDYVVNWENDGYEIRHFVDERGKLRSRPQNTSTYFHSSLSWSKVSTGTVAFRFFPSGFIYDVAGTSIFFDSPERQLYFAGLLNSKVINELLRVISPTINFEVGQIATLPIIENNSDSIKHTVKHCISIVQQDWDAQETSWNFKENELVRVYKENLEEGVFRDANRIVDIISLFKEYWKERFDNLHNYEIELNRLFIDIYGLQDELTPDVSLDEITILQRGEISVKGDHITWHNDVLVK